MITRPQFKDILEQDKVWWTAEGTAIPLEELSTNHRHAVLSYVLDKTQIRRAVGKEFPLIKKLEEMEREGLRANE